MDGADVCGTSSRASRRPPDVISAVAILDPRWRRRKWRHPGPGAVFSTPIAAAAQDGGPPASGRHLGWPHLRNRKWGHPRWRPEAEGPPSCAAAAMGVEKTALYYWRRRWGICMEWGLVGKPTTSSSLVVTMPYRPTRSPCWLPTIAVSAWIGHRGGRIWQWPIASMSYSVASPDSNCMQ